MTTTEWLEREIADSLAFIEEMKKTPGEPHQHEEGTDCLSRDDTIAYEEGVLSHLLKLQAAWKEQTAVPEAFRKEFA